MTAKKILVVVDPTRDEQPAVDHAARLAEHFSASLELFICDYDPDIAAGQVSTVWIDKPARENLLSILRERLESLAAPLREKGLEVGVDVAWDHPLDEGVVRKVVASKPWLVAKDTHHHSVLKRTILSNTDWHLIRQCPAPLFLVKPTPIADQPKVYAAVDPVHVHDKPAQLDHKIFEFAKTFAEGIGAELHVVHTYALPTGVGIPEGASVVEIAEAVEQEHRQAFADFIAAHRVPTENAHLVEGQAHERLAEIADEQGVDVIVMGAVSRSGLDRIFLGSTAERVLDRLSSDLLIIKPEGFEPSVT